MLTKLQIGALELENNLIQGPLAGVSCAPFRELFSLYQKPGYCVTEMISAHDIITKHHPQNRYLYKSPNEGLLAYQLSGNQAHTMSQAARIVEQLGADLIDINCGCPKPKIRKKGAGSALLDTPELLCKIVSAIKQAVNIPLTVKIRLQPLSQSIELARAIANAGADAIIIHGRTAFQDYDSPCQYDLIHAIKQTLSIPVITNGDIKDQKSLEMARQTSQTDGYMIARAGCGKPWLYQELLQNSSTTPHIAQRIELFIRHLEQLSQLENEFKALLQARTLIRYYFREYRDKLLTPALFNSLNIQELSSKLSQQIYSFSSL